MPKLIQDGNAGTRMNVPMSGRNKMKTVATK